MVRTYRQEDNEDFSILSKWLSSRRRIITLAVVAIGLGTGVELLGNALPAVLGLQELDTFILGFILILLFISLIIYITLPPTYTDATYEGFFVYSPKEEAVITSFRYHYGFHVADYLRAAFSENEAFKNTWLDGDLDDLWTSVEQEEQDKARKTANLLTEATEYYILKELSLHTGSYFSSKNVTGERTSELSRGDISDILLENRFLRLFSKPLSERAYFDDINDKNKIAFTKTERGHIYDRFEIILPRESKIEKEDNNNINIKTPRIAISFKVSFPGITHNLPWMFPEDYLEVSRREVNSYKIKANMSFNIRPIYFLTPKGWEEYKWIDSFVEKLRNKMSSDRFYQNIRWDTSLTTKELLGDNESLKKITLKDI